MLTKVLLLLISWQYNQVLVAASVRCIGENGQPVDWFIVYKLPENRESQHSQVVEGLGYVYMDSSTHKFTMPNKTISNKTSAVGHTLQQIYTSYQRAGEVAFLLYDDEDPAGKESFSKGHSKGDLAFDSSSGFWLVHSVPKFPPFAKDSYDYPDSGRRYGQSFFCVTFGFSSFNDIGLQIRYNGPYIYDHGGSEDLINQLPNIKKAIDGEFIRTDPYFHVMKLSSFGGVMHTSFAKSKYFDQDLYHDLVAPYFKASLLVETWGNGEGKLPSNCSVPTVENVEDLMVDGETFTETKDHSKWAISKSNELSLVCIGDINRMETQFIRGGGTLCVQSSRIWTVFHGAVTKVETCQKGGRNSKQIITKEILV